MGPIISRRGRWRPTMAAKHPKSFVSLDPADHLLSEREDALYAGHVLAAWAERYLEMKAQDLPAAAPS
jgi:putative redox protein